MTEKSEALRLADELDDIHTTHVARNAAAELRRLSAENDLLGSAADKLRVAWRDEVHCLMQDKRQLIAQRDALLKALKYHQEQTRPIQRTLDVIKAVEEGK